VKLPISDLVIKKMNELAGTSRVTNVELKASEVEDEDIEGEKEERLPTVLPANEPAVKSMTVEEAELEKQSEELKTGYGDEDYGGADKEEVVESPNAVNDAEEPTANPNPELKHEPRRTSRLNAGRINRDDDFNYSFSQFTVKEGLKRYGKEAKKAVKQSKKIIRSSMFLKEKFDAFGVFEKLKG